MKGLFHSRLGLSTLEMAGPLVFVILWSSGFVGPLYILPFASPFTSMAVRFGIATILLLCFGLVRGTSFRLAKSQVLTSVLTGVTLHTIYVGCVFYALVEGTPASSLALIISLQPILISIFYVLVMKEAIRTRQVLGLALSVVGVAFLFVPRVFFDGSKNHGSALGIALSFAALISGVGGTVIQKEYANDIPLISGMSIQYGTTFLISILASVFVESHVIIWDTRFTLGTLWTIFGLSLGSVVLYYRLLAQNSAIKVSNLLFLLPIITTVFQFIFFRVEIGANAYIGIALVSSGVWIALRERVTFTKKI